MGNKGIMRFDNNYIRLDKPLFSDEQKPKDCKKQTPDEGFKKGYVVRLLVPKPNPRSLFGDDRLKVGDEFEFDSYDKYDNSCYITAKFWTWGTNLDTIKIVRTMKSLTPKKEKK